jgi:SP family myo-inositol transporter-like MFS transporter 13
MSTDSDSDDIDLDIFDMTSEKRPLVHAESGAMYETVEAGKSIQNGAHAPGSGKTQGTSRFVYVLSFFAAIGGFLFGYDTGVISGAMLLLQPEFALNSVWEEMVVSATILFAAVFALVGGPLNERIGRRAVTVVASLVFTAGAVLLGVAQDKIMLLIGRSILGVGIGKLWCILGVSYGAFWE